MSARSIYWRRARTGAALCCAAVCVGTANNCWASGSFALPFDDVIAAGQGFAGAETDTRSTGSLTRNPAAAAWLENGQSTFGGNLVYYETHFDGQATRAATDGSTISGNNGGNPGRLDIPLPEATWAKPLDGGWIAGVSLAAPYGVTLRYDRNWHGRYHAVDSIIRGVELMPSLAYRIDERFSIGGGLRLQVFDVEFSNDVDLGARIQRDTTEEAGSDITTPACNTANEPTLPGKYDFYNIFEERKLGIGWLLGAMWRPTDATSFGIAFRSAIRHDLHGNAIRIRNGWDGDSLRNDPCLVPVQTALASQGRSFEEEVVQPALASSADTRFRSRMILPETTTFGARSRFRSSTLTMTIRWTRWSRFDNVGFTFDNGAPGVTEPITFSDSVFIGGGAEWSHSDRLRLRLGLAHETSTVTAVTRTARAPDGSRNYLTTGASYTLRPGLHIDLAAGYAYVPARSVTDLTEAAGTGNRLDGRFDPLHLFYSSSRLRWIFD